MRRWSRKLRRDSRKWPSAASLLQWGIPSLRFPSPTCTHAPQLPSSRAPRLQPLSRCGFFFQHLTAVTFFLVQSWFVFSDINQSINFSFFTRMNHSQRHLEVLCAIKMRKPTDPSIQSIHPSSLSPSPLVPNFKPPQRKESWSRLRLLGGGVNSFDRPKM